jgi:uncharacterized phage protein gp47/JayE
MAYTIKEQENIINDMLVDIVTNVTKVNDLNTGSVLRTLTESLAQEIYYQYQQMQNIYDGTRISTAEGDDLDNLGTIVGITRTEGNQAEVDVTFERESTVSSDFTIPAGTIVSTQPNSSLGQLKFVTLADGTFDASITDEEVTFNNGFYNYKLSERKIGDIITLTATVSSSSEDLTKGSDFSIVEDFEGYLPDNSDITTIDDCETADWSDSTDATADALNSTNYKEGSNSIDLGKSGTASIDAYYSKTLASVKSITNKQVFFWFYIKDATELAKFDNLKIRLSSDTTPTNNYYEFTLNDSLETGWNYYVLDYTQTGDRTRTGSPNTDQIKSLRIHIETNNTTDTITSGDIGMDFWFISEAEYYRGDIIQFNDAETIPDDGTTFYIDWKPLSVDITCQAEEIGEEYNLSQDVIIYKVSTISSINTINNYVSSSGGQDEESDTDYRARIQNAAAVAGNATTTALEQSILAIPGVNSVLVNDLPEKSSTDEPHVYNSSVDLYKLNNEIVTLDDSSSPTNFDIKDSAGGSSAYTYGTDYTVDTDTSEIDWSVGGTNPTSGNFFYVDYDYNWLGHVEIIVAGEASPISSDVQSDVDDAINETKAAGIQVTWTEPTINYINITSTVTVDTDAGYNSSTVKTEVQTAVINWLNAMEIGEDVLISEYINTVMNIDGVSNVSITNWDGDTSAPFSDVTIDNDEVARPEDSGIVVN